MSRKKIYKKVRIEGVYAIDGGYIPFPDNPYHGKEFENVSVTIKKETQTWYGIQVEVDVIRIGDKKIGTLPVVIECELVSKKVASDGTLVLQICNDWG
ncbi:MAG: hypothetical protein UGF89_00790 [Acutalibacteraceae bacterium]|nr:hypothetical protein [Acutalibacteraceae bacterium]